MLYRENYELLRTEAICPDCGSEAILFCPIKFDATKPAHYLCFTCGRVAQVGGTGTNNPPNNQNQAELLTGGSAQVTGKQQSLFSTSQG